MHPSYFKDTFNNYTFNVLHVSFIYLHVYNFVNLLIHVKKNNRKVFYKVIIQYWV